MRIGIVVGPMSLSVVNGGCGFAADQIQAVHLQHPIQQSTKLFEQTKRNFQWMKFQQMKNQSGWRWRIHLT